MFLLLKYTSVSSQNVPQIETLTTEHGLTFRDVRSIAQDTMGFMWFGTQQGLNQYDGYNFKVYNSNKDNPHFIEEDKITAQIKIEASKNELWYVASEQIFKLNIETDSISSYSEKNGVKGSVLFLYKDVKEQIWIVTDDYWKASSGKAKQYIQKFDGKDAFTVFAEEKRGSREFTHIISDNNNNMYWGTILKGVIKYNEDGKQLSERKLVSFIWYGEEMFYAQFYFDKANNQYYFPKGKKINGVLKLNKTTNKFEDFLDVPLPIYHALEDHQGSFWFAAEEYLYRVDTEGNVQDFTKDLKKHLDYSKINALFQDSNKLLWVATDNGLFKIRIKKQLFSQLFKTEKEGWGNTFRGIFETKEGSIIAMCESQYKLVGMDALGKEFEVPLHSAINNSATPIAASRSFTLTKDSTAVYSVNDNLIKINLDNGLITMFPEFNSRLNITSGNPLIALKDGSLLFGYSLSKLTVFNPESNESRLVFPNLKMEDNISELRFFLASKEENIVWVGTQNKGLLKINLKGTIEAIYNTKSVPALSNNTILVLFEDDNKLWIGTYGGGLDCFIPSENRIINFNKEQGLSDNNVVGILPYQEDFLWISTYDGLSLFDTKATSFQNFYVEDGLTHNEFNYTSFFKDSKGIYYFGGMNGITKFNPKPILKKVTMPAMRFTNYSKYSSKTNEIFKYELEKQKVSVIDISPYDQYFTVSWTMPNFFNISKNQYYTKLEGFEDRWYFQGNSSSIRYNKLPSGEYTLKVRGADSNGNKSSNVLSLPLTVHQIFYKTWWFLGLVFIAIIGFIYSVFNYRLQQLKAMNQLRTKISSDLHDDVGSLLSGLAMQTEMLEMNANEKDRLKLKRISKISRDAIVKMRDLVWSIDNRRERILDLIERMEELADEMLLPKEIVCKINKGNLNHHKKLPIAVKQQLYFIYKEAITNVLRHSNATKVLVSFKNNSGLGYLKIKDNGTESKKDSKTGMGLENMKMRAEKINAEINFYTINGFTILIKLPFAF
ncbi:hypothetical protein Lupro_03190 [Lutibacter profundi]|uniref:Two-component system sensor with a ligand-binding domain protein n=1 Tax=Lutibacter profundi TaxID=1622118 RepID=A0A0X8G595_9FLAO|nr:hypothetical protein Lupro_03190 [Lutibacter profundi]